MAQFNEHALETAIMELFRQQGYTHTCGQRIHREASDVLLSDDLHAYLRGRYAAQGITAQETEAATARLTAHAGGSLYEDNARTYRLMTEGFALRRGDASLADLYIEPIDFERPANNIFRIVNQLEIRGAERRIPDGIVYINGLPVVVLEFKSAVKEEATIADAFAQLTVRYRRDIPELFRYNAFVVVSDGVNSKYGPLFAPYEFFYAWRKADADDKAADGIGSLLTMVRGLFAKERLLSVLRDFVFLPDSSKRERKVVCRYPQFFAAHKLFDSIRRHSRLQPTGDGKGGTYFGATGCGKSLTMLFLTRMLMRSREFASPTVVLITDRTDLDAQLAELFAQAKRFIGDDCVVEVESRAKLREHLAGRTSGGVFLTTIHKFAEDTRLLSSRANIICISDEAHRSQTNLSQRVRPTADGVKRSYGFAKYLHDSLPNATYVGFTGTPVDATIDVFGDVVDAYTMTESVADGITRRIVYEGRAAKVLLDNAKLREIEEYYKKCAEEGTNEYQIEESKKAVTHIERILGDPDRLQAVAEDFVNHYENRVTEGATVAGKAMFVCSNRAIAYELYKKIVALRPEWAEKQDGKTVDIRQYGMAAEPTALYGDTPQPIERVKLVMTRNTDDEPALYGLLGTDEERKRLDAHFKNPQSNFKIAIVVDMWITGFDVPCLDTMYIDKPLQRHTLIQTISRVNRAYQGKEKGLVVDYFGIKNNMNLALKRYATGETDAATVETVEQSVAVVKDELDILRRMFAKLDYGKFTTGTPLEQLDCLNRGAEFVQSTKEAETLFMAHAKRLKSAFGLCSGQITEAEREDVYYFCGVRSVIYKLTKSNAPDTTQMNRRVGKMIEEAIISENVEEIMLAGNNTENLDVLSEEYMERLAKLKLPNTKVKLMERLLKTVIAEFKKVNKIKGVDFSQRLNSLVEKYNDRSDNAVFADEVLTEVASQMAELLKEINAEKRSFKELGITYEEKAFYDILIAVAKQFGFDYPKPKAKRLAVEIKAIVDNKSKYTDWAARDDIKAELKMDLILVLAQYGYPPVTNDEVFKEIFEQAENFKKYNAC